MDINVNAPLLPVALADQNNEPSPCLKRSQKLGFGVMVTGFAIPCTPALPAFIAATTVFATLIFATCKIVEMCQNQDCIPVGASISLIYSAGAGALTGIYSFSPIKQAMYDDPVAYEIMIRSAGTFATLGSIIACISTLKLEGRRVNPFT